ncbi:transposase family protein [Kitasatospora sp. NPDC056138]|uniref:transposase family protein n=1 Tax=Kitasatospora sp. NPDC056138 TaxID=3345724 RepID=UPI0035E00377
MRPLCRKTYGTTHRHDARPLGSTRWEAWQVARRWRPTWKRRTVTLRHWSGCETGRYNAPHPGSRRSPQEQTTGRTNRAGHRRRGPAAGSPLPGCRVRGTPAAAGRPAAVPDPRRAKGRRHPLAFVLALAACAVPTGTKSLAAVGTRPAARDRPHPRPRRRRVDRPRPDGSDHRRPHPPPRPARPHQDHAVARPFTGQPRGPSGGPGRPRRSS